MLQEIAEIFFKYEPDNHKKKKENEKTKHENDIDEETKTTIPNRTTYDAEWSKRIT